MGTVQVEIKGTFPDPEHVRQAMERVLSITGGDAATDERTIDRDGIMTYTLTVSADETPGGADEYEFSRMSDAATYIELEHDLNGVWQHLDYLQKQGVLKPDATLMRELEVFRGKLTDYLKGFDELR